MQQSKQVGFTLIEVLIALSLLGFAITAANQMVQHSAFTMHRIKAQLDDLSLVPQVNLKVESSVAEGKTEGIVEQHGQQWHWKIASTEQSPMLSGVDLETGYFSSTEVIVKLHNVTISSPSGKTFTSSVLAWSRIVSTVLP